MACLAAVEGARTPPEPPIVAPGWYGKLGGVYSEPSVYRPTNAPEPAAAAAASSWPPPPNSPPQPTPKHLLKTEEANQKPIPAHYLKSGQQTEPWSGFISSPGWAGGMEQQSIWDPRWSPPRNW
jgi:hypothetical protein